MYTTSRNFEDIDISVSSTPNSGDLTYSRSRDRRRCFSGTQLDGELFRKSAQKTRVVAAAKSITATETLSTKNVFVQFHRVLSLPRVFCPQCRSIVAVTAVFPLSHPDAASIFHAGAELSFGFTVGLEAQQRIRTR